jgi:DNA-binding PadR family transcriptional regulator
VAIHHAVLGLLAGGPSYGYELKANFERAIGPQWGELNIGHLYQVLERLERDGLVTGKDIPQDHRPDKRTYRLTKEGRAELNRWLDEPSTRHGGYRDDVSRGQGCPDRRRNTRAAAPRRAGVRRARCSWV